MKRLLFALLASTVLLGSRSLGAQEFAVVVNAANPVTSLSREQLSRIFLKKAPRWDDGQPVAPVDMGEASRVREAFTLSVHGKSVKAVKSFWQQQIFSGRDVPPPEKESEAEVLAFVRANPAAVGYVAAGTEVGRGVKVVAIR